MQCQRRVEFISFWIWGWIRKNLFKSRSCNYQGEGSDFFGTDLNHVLSISGSQLLPIANYKLNLDPLPTRTTHQVGHMWCGVFGQYWWESLRNSPPSVPSHSFFQTDVILILPNYWAEDPVLPSFLLNKLMATLGISRSKLPLKRGHQTLWFLWIISGRRRREWHVSRSFADHMGHCIKLMDNCTR